MDSTSSNSKRNCVDCGKEYDALVLPNGDVAGSGRCPGCQRDHIMKMGGTREVPGKSAFQAVRVRDPFTRDQECIKCHAKYIANHAYNILGADVDQSRGLCPPCLEKRRAQEEKAEAEGKRRAIEDKREKWRASCGIPLTYRRERFETWQHGRPGNVDKIFDLCEKYANEFPLAKPDGFRSLVLTSVKVWGLGKSHLACSIAHRILDRWNGDNLICPVCVVTEPDLFARIRATYNHPGYTGEAPAASSETEENILKKLSWVPLLILDDIGKEDVDNLRFVQRYLFRIINARYNNNKLPMVLTSNLTDAEFRQHLGGGNEASLDRLIESCGGNFYTVKGKSFRRKSEEDK